MGDTEKIRIIMVKRDNMSDAKLARLIKTSPKSLSNKMKRDNFTQSDLRSIAKALDCTHKSVFVVNETGEVIGTNTQVGSVEKIRIALVKRGNITEAKLAKLLGISPQNLNQKMKRDNFTQNDLMKIADALVCTYKSVFVLNDTGEVL